MVETAKSAALGQDLELAIVSGDLSIDQVVRACIVAGWSPRDLRPVLLAVERAIAETAGRERPSPVAKSIADRLALAFDQLPSAWFYETGTVASPTGNVTVVGLPGDGHSVGRQLWQALLSIAGYAVEDIGVRAPVIAARQLAERKPDAVALNVFDTRGRAAVQLLVGNLLRRGLSLPLLLGGPGVDEGFAQRVAIAEYEGPYWGGVYYCSGGEEMLQVLQQVVLFEPPAQAHSHHHLPAEPAPGDDCESCGACPLADACDVS